MGLYVRHFRLTCELANTYVVCNAGDGKAWIVDVGEMSARMVEWIKKSRLTIIGIVITHAHYDHNGAVEEYLQTFGEIPVFGGSEACAPGRTTVVADGQRLMLGDYEAHIFSTPGHTPDHIMVYFPEQKILFSGDALFAGSVGGTHSEKARRTQLQTIREKVLTLSPDVRIYPGHGPPTTVQVEREANPFFECETNRRAKG